MHQPQQLETPFLVVLKSKILVDYYLMYLGYKYVVKVAISCDLFWFPYPFVLFSVGP